jgi:hypothetical protein
VDIRRLRKAAKEMEAELHRPEDERERKREEWRAHIRHAAECANRDRGRENLEPIFEITDDGTVYTFDGRLVDDRHQSLAETFYWMEVGWGSPGLVHDEEEEAFYTLEGELAVSRTRCDLQILLNR